MNHSKEIKELPGECKRKLEQLEAWFRSGDGSIVAFSGGIDSSLVLYLARRFQGKKNAIGVISRSGSLKKKDFQLARSFSRQYDILMEVILTRELEDERYNRNPFNRCYFCKDHLYSDLQHVREKYPGFRILNGTNADDHTDYRPGIKAAGVYHIHSPLVECGVTKEEIRKIARFYGLPNWNKPASPCLSSRIPYNQRITRKKLMEIEQAEELLNSFGFNEVRVRHYGDYAKIEVKRESVPRLLELEEKVVKRIMELGFKAVEIDREGLVSGKMNRVVP
ncbi:MAG: ATP-dependent sacrificial sulfur transferase LarE [Bacteroidales bacterium]